MGAANWEELFDAGDPAAARAAWQGKFAGDCESLPATWELAEIEERWGDALFFGGEEGAAVHYQAAWRALVPLGVVFSSADEDQRRMDAYARITVKLRAIDPYGKARADHTAEPHPNFRVVEAQAKPPGIELADSTERDIAGSRSVAEQMPEMIAPENPRPESPVAPLSGHWLCYDLAGQWRECGKELSANFPGAARRAYQLSLDYFERYNQAWNAHAPASRWDSDGGWEMHEVQQLMRATEVTPSERPLPVWVEALLSGDWQAAASALGTAPAPEEFKVTAELLAEAVTRHAG